MILKQKPVSYKQQSQENLIQILRCFDIEQYTNALENNTKLHKAQREILKEFITQHYQNMEKYQKEAQDNLKVKLDKAAEQIQQLFLSLRQSEGKLEKSERARSQLQKALDQSKTAIDELEREIHKKEVAIKGLVIQSENKDKKISHLQANFQKKNQQTLSLIKFQQQREKQLKETKLLIEEGLIKLKTYAAQSNMGKSTVEVQKNEIIQAYQLSIADMLEEKHRETNQMLEEKQEVIKTCEIERQARKKIYDSIEVIFTILRPKISSIFEWKNQNIDRNFELLINELRKAWDESNYIKSSLQDVNSSLQDQSFSKLKLEETMILGVDKL